MFLLLCLLVAKPLAARQNDEQVAWEFFRGPNFDGHSTETGIVDSFPDQGPPVLWTRKLGQGYSSFVGRGGRVFTQYQNSISQFVVCLDAENGRTIWEYSYDWSYQTAGLYPGPRATPTLDGDKLYFTSPGGLLGCLRQNDGTLIWQVNLKQRFKAKSVGFGYACSPVVVDQKLFLPVGGAGAAVVAFDKENGAVIWQTGDYEISYASVLPIERGNRSMLVAFLQNSLIVLDQEIGEVLAELSLSQGYDEHSAWPIYSEPYLLISAPFREGSKLLELTGVDSFELKPVWNNELMSNDVCSSVLRNGNLYGFDIFDVQSKVHRPSRGVFRCLDFKTGKSRWENGTARQRRVLDSDEKTAATDSVGHSSIVSADGKLILLNDTGEVILIQANPERFEELARAQVLGGEICWTQPMLLNRRLYLRNHSRAVCLYLGNPADLGDSNTMKVADIPQSSYFDIASFVFSVEPEYAMDAPTANWLVNWYWIMLAAGWGVAFPLGTAIAFCFDRSHNGRFLRRGLVRLFAISVGIAGTTVISRWFGDFVFTWPLALAAVFELLAYQLKTRNRRQSHDSTPHEPNCQTKDSLWPGRLALVVFVFACWAYFYLCRRLSLAFEWSFLIGFPAAIPFLLAARHYGNKPNRYALLAEWLLTAIAFTAFYWIGAAVILWKY